MNTLQTKNAIFTNVQPVQSNAVFVKTTQHIFKYRFVYGLSLITIIAITIYLAVGTTYQCQQKVVGGDYYCRQRTTSGAPPQPGPWSKYKLGQCTNNNPPCV